MFSHGTLLFDSEIDHVVSALKVKMDKIQSKGIKSIRSRVANITEFLNEKMTTEEFRQLLLETIFEGETEIPTYELTEEDWKAIHKLSEERYQNWDWNYGKSPKFNLQHSHRFPVGQVDVRLEVKKGTVTECKIYGDFFGSLDVHDIEERLTGVQFDKDAFTAALEGVDIKRYFGNITTEDFLHLFF